MASGYDVTMKLRVIGRVTRAANANDVLMHFVVVTQLLYLVSNC